MENGVANSDKLYQYCGNNVSNNSLVTHSILALPRQKFPGKNLWDSVGNDVANGDILDEYLGQYRIK